MTLKNNFKSELESLHSGLIEVNDWMYENPETGFEEFETSKHLVNYIKPVSYTHLTLPTICSV